MTDAIKAVEQVNSAFAEHVKTVDQNIKAHDVLLDEKITRLDKALDDGADAIKAANKLAEETKARADKLEVALQRTGSDGKSVAERTEHQKAFDMFLSKGIESDLLTKSLSTDSDPDGGYLVPDHMDSEITRIITDISDMRSIASVQTISGGAWKRQVVKSGSSASWVGETATRSETTDPVYGEVRIQPAEMSALHNATQNLLDDSRVSIEGEINQEFAIAFDALEGAAFITGDGIDKPRGFLDYTKTTTASYTGTWGEIEFFPTGASGAFNGTDPDDELIDIVHSIKKGYRSGSSWAMNRSTLGAVRKLRDANNLSLWQPDTQAGNPGLLMGYAISEMEDMDDIAANSYSVAFGNFKLGYQIIDRFGTRILRDPYSNKPFVQFYGTRRVGGGVKMFEAIKLIKFA